jgi:membrane protein implicated in regulation of membrane protease activity
MLILLALVALLVLPAPWGIVAVVSAAAVEVLELVFWKRFLRRYRLRSGPETLIGTRATVVEACFPAGRVRVRGELWNARSTSPVEAGEPVVITALDGLTLEVEPEESPELG